MNKLQKMAVSLAAVFSLLATSATPSFAAPHPLNWRAEVNKAACNPVGNAIVNIKQRVVNDADSGEAGNYWAFDEYKRTIKVFSTATPNEYCAIVSYDGKFDAQAGQTSPGNTGVLTGDEDGNFNGGYRATITGTLLADPTWDTKGNVGTFDYQCDLSGNCPGRVSWTDQYFNPGYVFAYEWWGWQYKNTKAHIWINSVDGNSGDVL